MVSNMPYADLETRRKYHAEYMRKRRATSEKQREYDRDVNRQYHASHSESRKESSYQWRRDHPEEWRQLKRRADRRSECATPDEYSGIKLVNICLEVFYEFRDLCAETTGIPHHVDHIQPFCKGGQHVPWNLQVITADENLRKATKFTS